MKIIKISDTHYIGVEKSTIREGDWIYNPVLKSLFAQVTDKTFPAPYAWDKEVFLETLNYNTETFKITHSSIPIEEGKFFLIKPLFQKDVLHIILSDFYLFSTGEVVNHEVIDNFLNKIE